ncbi:transposase [Ralstonia solanacearum]|nr:transposase [Ralstonia solanacearum]QKM32938.1 transposase [Ralstonia solanacearum]QKM37924.1 transposase [Ralstonia solanacearum]
MRRLNFRDNPVSHMECARHQTDADARVYSMNRIAVIDIAPLTGKARDAAGLDLPGPAPVDVRHDVPPERESAGLDSRTVRLTDERPLLRFRRLLKTHRPAVAWWESRRPQ